MLHIQTTVYSDFKKKNLIEYASTVLIESGPQQIAFENMIILVWSMYGNWQVLFNDFEIRQLHWVLKNLNFKQLFRFKIPLLKIWV